MTKNLIEVKLDLPHLLDECLEELRGECGDDDGDMRESIDRAGGSDCRDSVLKTLGESFGDEIDWETEIREKFETELRTILQNHCF